MSRAAAKDSDFVSGLLLSGGGEDHYLPLEVSLHHIVSHSLAWNAGPRPLCIVTASGHSHFPSKLMNSYKGGFSTDIWPEGALWRGSHCLVPSLVSSKSFHNRGALLSKLLKAALAS